MVIRIGPRPEVIQPSFDGDVDGAAPIEPPPPPPPPAPVEVPTGYDDEPSQAKPLAEPAGYSGRVTATFQHDGTSEPVQLVAVDGALSYDGREVGRVVSQRADGTLELELLGKPTVGQPAGPPGGTVNQLDLQPFPGGPPESYVKTQFPPAPGATAERQAMVDTVVGVFPAAQQASVRALLDTGGDLARRALEPGVDLVKSGVSDESLQRAFDAVLAARKSPGKVALELELVPQRTLLDPEVNGGDAGPGPRLERVESGTPVKLAVALDVDAQGKVNGAPLVVDELTRLNTELTKVSPDLKLDALRQAGVPEDFIAAATPAQRDEALAKLRAATLTPGQQTVTLAHEVFEPATDDSGGGRTRRVETKLTLNVDAQGNVDGKPLFIETALATNRVMEQLPMAEKRAMLQRLGFAADDLKPLGPDRATDILTKVALATRTPGEHSLEVDTGPDKFAIALKVSANGDIEGSGVTKLPPPPKKSLFQKIAGPLLTVASIAFPEFAPIIRVVQAGMAVANGARGAGLVGAVLGGAAGFAELANATSLAGTLSSAAGVVNGVNGAVQSFRNGDLLGAFSSAVSLAGSAGSLARLPNFVPEALRTAGDVAGVASSLRAGDVAGAFSGAFGAAAAAWERQRTPSTSPATTAPATEDEGGPAEARGAQRAPAPVDDLGDERTVEIGVGTPAPSTAVDDDLGDGRTVQLDTGGVDDLGDDRTVQIDAEAPEEQASPGAQPADGSRLDPLDLEPRSTRVREGDSLIRIAQRELQDASRWPELYAYNRDILDNPNAIAAGAELKLPPPDFQLSPEERNAIIRGAALPPRAPASEPGDVGSPGGASDDNDVGVREQLGEPLDPETARDLASRMGPPGEELKPELQKLADDLKLLKDKASLVPGGAAAVEELERLVRAKDVKALKQFFDNPGLVSTLADIAKNPTLGKFLGPLGKFLDIASPVLSAAGAAYDTTNTTEVGRAYNAISNGLIDLLVGKTNPLLAFADTAIGLVARGLGGDDRYTPSRNLAGGVQSLIALMETVAPGDRSAILDRIIRQNESGANGVVIQGATALSQRVVSPLINDAIFGLMDYFKTDPAVVAAEARKARDTMRARIRQQGG